MFIAKKKGPKATATIANSLISGSIYGSAITKCNKK